MQARYSLEGAPASCYEELSYWEKLEHDIEMEELGVGSEGDESQDEIGSDEDDVFEVPDGRLRRGLRLLEED